MLISSKAREMAMMRAYRFYLLTIGLLLFSFMMMTVSVNAAEDKRLQHKDEYYEEIENCYIRELREALSTGGYRNAGITMTKVFYEDGQSGNTHRDRRRNG